MMRPIIGDGLMSSCCGQEELRECVLPWQRPVGYVEAWFMCQFTIHPDSKDDLERRVSTLAKDPPHLLLHIPRFCLTVPRTL